MSIPIPIRTAIAANYEHCATHAQGALRQHPTAVLIETENSFLSEIPFVSWSETSENGSQITLDGQLLSGPTPELPWAVYLYHHGKKAWRMEAMVAGAASAIQTARRLLSPPSPGRYAVVFARGGRP